MQILSMLIEQLGDRWLSWWHGAPVDAEGQFRYYRCEGCKRLVTWKGIAQGGCWCGLSQKLRPAVMRWYEKVQCFIFPWTV